MRRKRAKNQLMWLGKSMTFALEISGENAKNAYSFLYLKLPISRSMNENDKARINLCLIQPPTSITSC